MTKAQQFRALLNSRGLEFLMEAHNGLSARIVEEAGFRGIWASGLSISASLGVRDNNEASWTQVLEVVEFMSDAGSIPILLDADTGYGNFNNIRRLVRKLEQRGIAAVCIEDKQFPKSNSFIRGEEQPLAEMEEFVGKIKAAKNEQRDPDFAVVARLEGFIAGRSLEETLVRARAYAEAGADALLVHSKKSTPDQVLAFARAWQGSCPLIIVPTMYYSTPTAVFEQAGIRMVIWANHNLRAAIQAMQSICQRIHQERSVVSVEDQVVPVQEVFRLQNAQELLEAEQRYLPARPAHLRAVILAASRGAELGDLTANRPKAMVLVRGIPLLHHLVARFREAGIRDIVVVRGYGKEEVHAPHARFVDNPDYEGTRELLSLAKAQRELQGDVVLSFADILFRRYILRQLLAEPGEIVMVVDAAWNEQTRGDACRDFVATSRPYSLSCDDSEVLLTAFSPQLSRTQINGEWIGLMKCSTQGAQWVQSALDQLRARPDFAQLTFEGLFRHLLDAGHPVHVLYVTGHWLDVDRLSDLAEAQTF